MGADRLKILNTRGVTQGGVLSMALFNGAYAVAVARTLQQNPGTIIVKFADDTCATCLPLP